MAVHKKKKRRSETSGIGDSDNLIYILSVPASAHPFFSTGSTQAAKETVDHLNATENHLQAACGQESAKQPNVEVHNVTRLYAFSPIVTVSQVTWVTMQ